MANRFIDTMDKSGDRSEARLRRLYRAACKRVHPDSAGPGAGSEAFLSIRNDYEEAVAVLAATSLLAESVQATRADATKTGVKPNKALEPVLVAAFRNASARFGADAALARCDEYAWTPPEALVASVVDSARALYASPERPAGPPLDAENLIVVLEAIRLERKAIIRYPGIMTRYGILYRGFQCWWRYRTSGSEVDAAAARTRIDGLEDSRSTIVRSQAMAHIADAFPMAAMMLRSAWGLGDPRIIIDPDATAAR